METSPLICRANQWTGFYMITASVMKELTHRAILSILAVFIFNFKQLLTCLATILAKNGILRFTKTLNRNYVLRFKSTCAFSLHTSPSLLLALHWYEPMKCRLILKKFNWCMSFFFEYSNRAFINWTNFPSLYQPTVGFGTPSGGRHSIVWSEPSSKTTLLGSTLNLSWISKMK